LQKNHTKTNFLADKIDQKNQQNLQHRQNLHWFTILKYGLFMSKSSRVD
jgi:hypothetical protein